MHSTPLKADVPAFLRSKGFEIPLIDNQELKKKFLKVYLKYDWFGEFLDTHTIITSCEYCLK